MIKGLAITPPILGRISIGRMVEKNGKRLPEKDDQFTITSQIQNKDGWVKHPLDEQLRAKTPNQKLRTIPVRMIFNDPELNLRAEYSLFDRQTGRPVCVGNGETCQRLTNQGVEQHPCPSPDLCPLAQEGNCKPYGRLHVNLDESDELGTFIFRTTGFNSIRTLAARLAYYHAASGGLLSCIPLQLTLRGKSTTQSYRAPVYYVDLTLREGVQLHEAIQTAQEIKQQIQQSGFQQVALDQIARQGFANARFEVSCEEGLEVGEEFYGEEKHKQVHDVSQVQEIQKGLQQSVKAVH
ncbi:hydrolase or metal-binding protein [Acinetobacter rudis]|uniref:recombination directionality factor n=1 Tax=Acinetobacter rudis TaxID=632955 RepID=UPI0033418A6A